jgi:eukaryotic-like serine/threonine-protein kinase
VSSGGRPKTRTLAGRYRLDEVIGRGGMSTVYRGTDLSLDREVAVKVALDPLAEENPVYVARFKREARAAAALSHPGVVTVYDAGADGPTRYIVMELVDGQSLAELLREEPDHRLEPARAARIAEEIADTLAAAHAAGVVHRDIKPGNVMITRDDRVKVLDFGIARTADGVTLTQAASVLGTAPYMAPEQAMGNPADARSDIYSLGCVLYEMLTGRPPFIADLPEAVLHQQVRVQPKPPSERNPAVPPALNALVLEMLAKRPEDRPQTAAAVRDRLAAFLSGDPTAPTTPIAPVVLPPPTEPPATEATVAMTPPVVPSPIAPPDPTAGTQALPPTPAPRRKRGAGLYVALAAIAVVLIGAAVAYAIAGGGSKTSSSTAQSAPHATTHVTSHTETSSTPATTSNPTTSTAVTTTTKTVTTSSTPTTTSTPATSTPGTTPATPPGQGGTPPGQGGTPPGQATGGTTP